MKMAAIMLVIVIAGLFVCGCNSPKDELRRARQTQKEAQMLYEQELKRYENLKDDIERYERLRKQVDNAQ